MVFSPKCRNKIAFKLGDSSYRLKELTFCVENWILKATLVIVKTAKYHTWINLTWLEMVRTPNTFVCLNFPVMLPPRNWLRGNRRCTESPKWNAACIGESWRYVSQPVLCVYWLGLGRRIHWETTKEQPREQSRLRSPRDTSHSK